MDDKVSKSWIDLQKCCRTCTKELDTLQYDVFKLYELSSWIQMYTSLEILENDGLPRYLCTICKEKIQDFYDFRQMCIESAEKLRHIINCNSNVIETVVSNDNGADVAANNDNLFLMKIENNEKDDILPVLDKTEINSILIENLIEPINDKINTRQLRSKKSVINQSSNEIKVDLCVDEIDSLNRQNENKSDDFMILDENDDEEKCDFILSDLDVNNDDVETDEEVKPDKESVVEKRVKNTKSNKFNKSNQGDKSSKIMVYKCEICEKRYLKEEKYTACVRKHKGLNPWVCTVCKKEYRKKASLKNHMMFFHSQDGCEMIKCPFEGCDKTYRLKQTMLVHYKRIHTKEIIQPKRDRKFICEECGKSFKTKNSLTQHHYSHTGEFPYKCEYCPKRCTTRYQLEVHYRRHDGIKNYICSICGLKKITQQELNTHMNYHSREKVHRCSFCPYSSCNNGNVIRHEKIVHQGIKTFECKFCGRTFGKAETLRHHEMTHTGEKPHQCTICDRRFIQSTALKVHLKRHEKNTIKSSKIKNPNNTTIKPIKEEIITTALTRTPVILSNNINCEISSNENQTESIKNEIKDEIISVIPTTKTTIIEQIIPKITTIGGVQVSATNNAQEELVEAFLINDTSGIVERIAVIQTTVQTNES